MENNKVKMQGVDFLKEFLLKFNNESDGFCDHIECKDCFLNKIVESEAVKENTKGCYLLAELTDLAK